MRVALLSRPFPPAIGGMERFAEELAAWLVGSGHDVAVVTRTPGPATGGSYRVLRRPSPAAYFRAVRWADVVHVNGLSLREELPSAAWGRRPVITHAGLQAVCPTGMAWSEGGPCTAGPSPGPCEACPGRGPAGRFGVFAHRAGARAAAANVCISRYVRDRIRPPHPSLILNPVSPAAFAARSPGEGEPGLVAFAGRLVREKGVHVLLQAFAEVSGARLELAGDGPERSSLEAEAGRLGVAERVRFLGPLGLSGVLDLYGRASVVCVPSIWDEPFGYSAAEAMAMERPVVAFPSGGLVELLSDGRGFLAEGIGSGPLARALTEALGDPAGRAAAAAAASSFARTELAIEVAGSRYVARYESAAR
jgi:glycogen synthase